MGHKFAQITFTESVREAQIANGSRAAYATWDDGPDIHNSLTEREASFIAERDSFYMATVSESGWPYVQHRGGPVGFVRVLNEKMFGFSDYTGNRQYVSVGNMRQDDRVSLFFMDYPNRKRLKLLGRSRLVEKGETELLDQLTVADYRARVERSFVITVEAFDWNCPQHITPRFTESQIKQLNQDKGESQ
jgi:predicted pyridoxine 5'-phosphate oxidase superfamily flavin-nucleotide-binding protein